jgi:hypothetical protein
MTILQNLLNSELTEEQVRIKVEAHFDFIRDQAQQESDRFGRSKTLGEAKSLLEFIDLVRQAIDDYEIREGVSEPDKVLFTEEEPDYASRTETITFSLIRREPGAFSQGAPFEGKVKNLRPRHRETGDDPTQPGYRQMVTGYWYDNLIRLTCWARTNKAANARAQWLEGLMEDYSWWFVAQGTSRVLYQGQSTDLVTVVDNNKWYGRPIDFFVRTERLRTFKEKTLEEILIKLVLKKV